jgi:hypothetical protein
MPVAKRGRAAERGGRSPTHSHFSWLLCESATYNSFFFRVDIPMPLFVLEPPAYYVHHYNGPVTERVLPLSEARKACAGRGVHADACAWTSNGACHLIIPSNGPVRNRGAYRRHELAHCNGWDHASHPASEQDPLKAIR